MWTCFDMARRYVLSKKERKKLVEKLTSIYGDTGIDKDDVVEIYEEKGKPKVILVNGEPAFIEDGGRVFPHLKYLLKHPLPNIPVIVVDMGAVKPLLRGADLMAPGIRDIKGSFHKGDVVVVVEEKYHKPFVVGLALIDSEEIVSGKVKRGKVVKNIHRIGDSLWDLI
jgi:PUA-domain protein